MKKYKTKKIETSITNVLIISFLFIFLFLSKSYAQDDDYYEYIEINKPYINKIPVAVPMLKAMKGKSLEKKKAKELCDIITKNLNFTGFFQVQDRDSLTESPNKTGIVISKINFKNWIKDGTELLITGGILLKKGTVEVELRLFDTINEIRIIGKKYIQNSNNIKTFSMRKIANKFSSKVIEHITGEKGIFNSKISYISDTTGNKEIYICEFDGYSPTRFTFENNITLSPAWSSDGKWIAYTSYKRGRPDIYIKNFKKKYGAIVSKKGINITPAWLPGTDNLAGSLSFSGSQGIYLLTTTGKIIKRITRKWSDWGIDVSPTFSPDGKKMAFVSKRSGTPQIFIKELASGYFSRLTYYGKNNTGPYWSPVEDKIAYTGIVKGKLDIYLIGVNDDEPVRLTDTGDNESPSWSPDGSMIAFSSRREGPSKIYVMTKFGTEQRRLLSTQGNQSSPSWSPNIINN